jgi:hypothetical protein
MKISKIEQNNDDATGFKIPGSNPGRYKRCFNASEVWTGCRTHAASCSVDIGGERFSI